jgi:hypothetical protein
MLSRTLTTEDTEFTENTFLNAFWMLSVMHVFRKMTPCPL